MYWRVLHIGRALWWEAGNLHRALLCSCYLGTVWTHVYASRAVLQSAGGPCHVAGTRARRQLCNVDRVWNTQNQVIALQA
jgi:hypothetical protein